MDKYKVKYYSYDQNKFPFEKIVQDLFDVNEFSLYSIKQELLIGKSIPIHKVRSDITIPISLFDNNL